MTTTDDETLYVPVKPIRWLLALRRRRLAKAKKKNQANPAADKIT